MGILSTCIGIGVCAWLVADKLMNGAPLANRRSFIGVLLIVVGIQLLSTGLVADLLFRTYYESQDKRAYSIRREHRADEPFDPPNA